ncbi:exodeoxyribonuclease V subunit beta [Buchnera aphidicola (Melanaphis sacchari)]|uniref:RecBCD enzyme subunit RecB n=1 Tax=Buchnera aphidicola (Melanaphis sacchari) TaxID=2173854 RepID=A0A2U8DET0_9GAMM|nr:exodeoxyribonuclease V subunit beta [Buchnera aphidicola]AWH90350.1 exodeoxyribonuclease V subunit beta [Buchnera aphidicola (Melanaphis sacchari)]
MKQKLNILKIPFGGVNLIEASAGTGKTSTIAFLYLRALLGLNNTKHFQNVSVKNILVVTFTNAAKEELYIRIKKSIEELHLSCINKKSTNSIFKLFLDNINNIDEAIKKLEKAKKNINNACIYTIHGFCQDIIKSNTFFFNKKIIENESSLQLKAVQDFWRYYFYHLPKDIINIIYQYYKTPESLLAKLKSIFFIDSINLKKKFSKKETIIEIHKKNINEINFFKKEWLNNKLNLLENINQLKLNKRIYNKSNIFRWFKKIECWAKFETKNYDIPDCLKYFSKNFINQNVEKRNQDKIFLNNIFFEKINNFLKKNFSLKNIILFNAIKKIKFFFQKEKRKKSLLGFNDLLKKLSKKIKKEKYLKKLMLKKYPITFIDEFQDTDIEQYQIFNTLYDNKNNKKTLFLIGDPKQAIYSFRGADIFSYLYAKSKIKKYYYLNTNWRSSKEICSAINYLFSIPKNPFLLKNISFKPVLSCKKNLNLKFKINNITQIAMEFFFKEEKTSRENHQHWIARQCANQINYWLISAQRGNAIFEKENKTRELTADDIVVLVRNKTEAKIIEKALNRVNIMSQFSSLNKSVFHTLDAHELLWILQNILDPTNIYLLRKSITTHIFSKILLKNQKKEISQKEKFYKVIEEIYKYQKIWKNIGISYTIKKMVMEYQNSSNDYEIYQNNQKNINFLHIAELLEKKSQKFYQKNTLIRWFEEKILDTQIPKNSECIKYFKTSDVIKINTIHKSKGLEYPIVWIPFGINYSSSQTPLYHNEKNFKLFFDIDQDKKSLIKSDKERLAEDIRFLYVSLTRAIYHISMGIGYTINQKKKNKDYSDIHKSALGYIIQNGKKINYENLLKKLILLDSQPNIKVKNQEINFNTSFFNFTKKIYFLSQSPFLFKERNNIFQITSFTKIKKSSIYLPSKLDTNLLKSSIKKNNKKLTIHNFPKGINTGLLIHNILKKINFSEPLKYDLFNIALKKYNLPQKWNDILKNWIKKIIHLKLEPINIKLSLLNKKKYMKEFEFFLPIKNVLYSQKLNKIIKKFDIISASASQVSFNPLQGILKGVIDLIFIVDKKYYILDYKSNYLGENNESYSSKNIKKEIIKNRYDLQYQFYTVAINTYLSKKINEYHYKTHFGGVFYIFLRGIKNKNSIFYTYPNYLLIKKLTRLFSIEH